MYPQRRNDSYYEGVVWPGPSVYPDFTASATREWWVTELAKFFNPESGVDISGLWIDMNEPANFLPYLEANPERVSAERPVPPERPEPRIIGATVQGFERFVAGANVSTPLDEMQASGSAGESNTTTSGNDTTTTSGNDTTTSTNSTSDDMMRRWLKSRPRLFRRQDAPSNDSSGSNDTSTGQDPLTLPDEEDPSLDSQWLYPP